MVADHCGVHCWRYDCREGCQEWLGRYSMVIYGCVRDVDVLVQTDVPGVQAPLVIRMKPTSANGDLNVAVTFGGVTFNPDTPVWLT